MLNFKHHFSLKKKQSEIYVTLSKDSIDFNDDFSNIDELELFRFENLEKDTVNQKWIEGGVRRHVVVFGKWFKSKGKHNLKGIFTETINEYNDSLGYDRVDRNIYIDIPVYVTD